MKHASCNCELLYLFPSVFDPYFIRGQETAIKRGLTVGSPPGSGAAPCCAHRFLVRPAVLWRDLEFTCLDRSRSILPLDRPRDFLWFIDAGGLQSRHRADRLAGLRHQSGDQAACQSVR